MEPSHMTSIKIDRLDGLSSSVAIKGPCRVVATASILLTGLQIIDGVTLEAGDRVLVAGQASASENGIYVVDTGPWRRARDFNKTRDVVKGTQILITDGTVYAQSGWFVASEDPIYVGSSDITILQNIILNPAQLELLVQAAQEAADAAQSAETAAEDAADRAEAAAANINLPAIGTGDPGQILTVKSDKSGYEYRTTEIVVTTRTILKALPVFIKSAYLLETGREGSFILRTGTPAKADAMEGVIVLSNTSGYYWERVFSGPVDVRWFGARLDGSFDDTLNVQAALDYHGHARIPFTTAGVILNGLNVKTGYILEGGQGIYTGSVSDATAKEKVTVRFSGASAINITSWTFGANATVRGFYFIGTGSASGSGIVYKTATQPIMGVTLEDLDFNDCYGAIVDEVHASNWCQMIYVRRIACYFIRNTQILLRRSQGFIQYEDVRIDYVSNTGPITWDGARFAEIGGLELTRFDVLGLGNDTTYRSAAYGLVVSGVTLRSSVWMDRVLVDSLNTNGILIDGIFNVIGRSVSAGLVYGNSIVLQNCDFIDLQGPTIYGAKNLSPAPTSVQGLRLSGCTSGTISNIRVRDVKGIGYVLNNSQHIKLNGGVIRDNTGQGILEAGTSNFNLNDGVSVVANVGSLVQVGAQSATTNWIPAGGTFTASTVGAASIA
ncbi:right-handed parallel beta-helix repeat-containing protein [Brucella intermedia]|uniref:right-handed parallel beta-helix repeat-containing protein n=1 Tax=Brucella intermedia TaxID=94625 RepID=UPI001591077D|nr:right-handed parallel beta-helix repeat-containing protein [Brucella intermedia]